MGRRDKAIRGRFGDRRGRASGLPPDLVTLLDVERKKRMWRKYLPLWCGAVALGLVLGIGPSLWSRTAAPSSDRSSIAPQTLLQEEPSVDDQQWAARAGESADGLPAASTVTFGFCHAGGGMNCVVDGDTIWFHGQNIRVADIDAPETHEYLCSEEKDLGDRATNRLIQLVNSGPVELRSVDRDEDVYGRKLRIVTVNGVSVGDTLVREGLARYYERGKRPWC